MNLDKNADFYGDIRLKCYLSVICVAIMALMCFLHKNNVSFLLGGLCVVGLMLGYFLLWLISDLRALKRYKRGENERV